MPKYGEDEKFFSRAKKDWKEGRSFKVFWNVAKWFLFFTIFLVPLFGVIFKQLDPPITIIKGDNSPDFGDNAIVSGSFNKTVVNDIDPVYTYRVLDIITREDGEQYTRYEIEVKTRFGIEHNMLNLRMNAFCTQPMHVGSSQRLGDPNGRTFVYQFVSECPNNKVSDDGNLFSLRYK